MRRKKRAEFLDVCSLSLLEPMLQATQAKNQAAHTTGCVIQQLAGRPDHSCLFTALNTAEDLESKQYRMCIFWLRGPG